MPTNFPVSNDRPTSLVLDFHGWGGDINSHEKDSQLNIVADEDEEGFLVVSAQGMSDMNNTSKEQYSIANPMLRANSYLKLGWSRVFSIP